MTAHCRCNEIRARAVSDDHAIAANYMDPNKTDGCSITRRRAVMLPIPRADAARKARLSQGAIQDPGSGTPSMNGFNAA